MVGGRSIVERHEIHEIVVKFKTHRASANKSAQERMSESSYHTHCLILRSPCFTVQKWLDRVMLIITLYRFTMLRMNYNCVLPCCSL
jgi:hypothetical protein